MSLASILEAQESSISREVLLSFGTDPHSLFTKSSSDRWTLWRNALIHNYRQTSGTLEETFAELNKNSNRLLSDNDDDDATVDDPLSPSGRWALRIHDRELLQDIQKDVDRLFTEEYKKTLSPIAVRILHLWAKLHESYSYRQGMHELLRPLLLLASAEGVLNLEYEVYFMFQGLMDELQALYEHDTSRLHQFSNHELPLNKVCFDIHNTLLNRAAPDLKMKLDQLGIQPQIFGIRWLRCLFAREFEDKYCFGFWDILFSHAFFEQKKASLIECASFFAVAMLLRVRWRIMHATSQTEALEPLLRYPPFKSDEEAIQLARQAIQLRVLRNGPSPSKEVLNEEIMKQNRLGARLGFLIGKLEAELIKENSNRNEDKILQVLAQAKQVQDVLLGRIAEEDCYWGEG